MAGVIRAAGAVLGSGRNIRLRGMRAITATTR